MATLRQKKTLVRNLGVFRVEEGKLFNQKEYRLLRRNVPIRYVQIRKLFGNWARCLEFLRKTQPDLWTELENLGKPTSQASMIDLSAIEDENENLEE